MIVSAFGDESADETKQRVFAVAALFAPEPIWRVAEDAWLRRTGGLGFHAAECESAFANDPDPQKHKENLRFYADLVQIIAGSGLIGFGASLDLAGHREFFAEVPEDYAYYQCLMWVLRGVARSAVDLAVEPSAVKGVEFTFDHRRESEYNAGRLYDIFANLEESQYHRLLSSKISFDSRKNPRIQMADLLARETMKHMDNIVGPVRRPMRRSMQALVETRPRRFWFDHYTRAWCQSKRAQWADLERHAGTSVAAFHRWLAEHGLADNWSNRFRFVVWLDEQDGAA